MRLLVCFLVCCIKGTKIKTELNHSQPYKATKTLTGLYQFFEIILREKITKQ